MDIKLIKPDMSHENEVMSFRDSFIRSKKEIHGGSRLSEYADYAKWLDFLETDFEKAGFVDAGTFIAIRESDKKMVGIINLRYRLNDYLLNFGGNIGYSVRNDERRKGYAKEMVRQALEIYKGRGTDKVLITCDKINVASEMTIRAAGGILENELTEEDGNIVMRFWVNI